MKQLILALKRVLSHFPTKLPVGTAQFNTFVEDVIELSGQYAEFTSMKFAIASILIHADSSKGALPKNYFVVRLRKSAANQIASQAFQEIKAAQDKKQAEDTATSQAVPSYVEKASN
jgi:hypothetical protein